MEIEDSGQLSAATFAGFTCVTLKDKTRGTRGEWEVKVARVLTSNYSRRTVTRVDRVQIYRADFISNEQPRRVFTRFPAVPIHAAETFFGATVTSLITCSEKIESRHAFSPERIFAREHRLFRQARGDHSPRFQLSMVREQPAWLIKR